jgi:outer membrane protein TolC
LRAAYGAYDPALSFSGEHSRDEAGSRLLGGGFSIPGSVTEADRFSLGLGPGLTPWGMTYDLQGNLSDSFGHSFSVDTNGFLVERPFESSSGSASATITQPLLRNLWIDAPRLAIRVNKNLLQYSELALKLQVMTTITLLEQAYYDLIFTRQNVVVQQKAVELAEKLVSEQRKRVEVGALAPLDARQAESQAASTRADLFAAISQLAVQENIVKQLITSNYAEWADMGLEPTGTLTAPKREFNLQESWRRGLSLRPEIQQARLDVERAGIQLKYDRNQVFPQVDLFATYGYNGSGAEFSGALFEIDRRDRPFYSIGGQISIPLANLSGRNAVRSSKATLQQAVLGVKRVERDIMRAIDDDVKQAQASYERVAATRAAREYAEEALAAEQKKFDQGKSTTFLVLQMQRDLTAASGQEIQALDTYNKNLSQLSLDEGTTLERLGIEYDAD